MPLIGFTVFKEKLLSGEKCQTIRRPRKRGLKVGDRLYVYWRLRTKECQKLGESVITNIVTKKVKEFTERDAVKDGFSSQWLTFHRVPALEHLLSWLIKKYPDITDDWEFDVITFEPLCKESTQLRKSLGA